MQQQREEGVFAQTAITASWLMFICQAWATPMDLILHKQIGSRYLHFQALAVFPLVLMFCMFYPGYDLRPMVGLLVAYLAACAWARLGVLNRWWRGEQEHSRYTGWPRLMLLFPNLNEVTVKLWIEGPMVFLVGVALRMASVPLGTFLMFAGVAMFVSVAVATNYERTRAKDLRDSVFDQQRLMQLYSNR